jgi:hypothetical protein
MKRVVRSKVTQQYLQADGTWSSRLDQACCFLNTPTVLDTVQKYQLTNVEMVLMIADQPTNWDIVLPLRPQLLSDAAACLRKQVAL